MMDALALRRAMNALRADMPAADRRSASEAVCGRILALPAYRDAAAVMAYVAVRGELDLGPVIGRVLADGKALFLPRVLNPDMAAVRVNSLDELVPGCWGIPEPTGTQTASAADIDLILVPGVAFDRACSRMGQGKGYYDRFLGGGHGFALGVCYHAQLLDALRPQGHDAPMDAVLTERLLIRAVGHRPCGDRDSIGV